MGNVLVKNPTVCKHEKLNEHNERYFKKVQERNSTKTSRRHWRRLRHKRNNAWEAASLTDPSSTIEAREDETMVDPSQSDNTTSRATSAIQGQRKHSHRQYKPSVDGWEVKQKGRALKLRLAKNRCLQLAANGSLLSPISQDSSAGSRGFDPLRSPKEEDLNSEFDSLVSNGRIWVEVARATKVTAIAMSRTPSDMSKSPLLMAVGGEDGIITITEILDEQQIYVPSHGDSSVNDSSVESSRRNFGETLEFHGRGRIRSIDFSLDGQYLAIGGDGCTAYILRIIFAEGGTLENLEMLFCIERVDRIYSVQFNPNGSVVAMAGFDGKVALAQMNPSPSDASPPLAEVSLYGLLLCLDWSPDGSLLAVGASDKRCLILDSNLDLVHETSPRGTSVQTVKWNPDGAFLAIGDREVAILDGETFEIKYEISNVNHAGPTSKYRVLSLCWSPNGSYLAVGGSDGFCLVVETKGYTLVHEIRREKACTCLAWGQQMMPGGDYRRYLGVGDDSCNIALLKAGTETDRSVAESDDLSSAASSSYFSSGSDWVLREDSFRDMDEQAPELRRGFKPQGNITCVAFSRACKSKVSSYLAYSADDCSLTILTTRDWKPVFQMEFAKPIRALTFSNSNNHLALGGDEGVLYVLSVPSRSMISNTILSAPIFSIAFSKLDERLAVGSKDGVLTLICPATNWEPVGEIEQSEAAVLAQDWSSRNLAVGRDDGTIAVFDNEKVYSNFFVPQAELTQKLPIRSVGFGASGRFLAVGSEGGTVSIFSAKGGWVLCHQLKLGHTILSISWCPAGRYLAVTGKNKACKIIDTVSWAEVYEIHDVVSSLFTVGSTDGISSVDWSVDGKWIALGTTGGGIHVLDSSDWQLLAPSFDRVNLASGSFAADDSK